MKVNLYGTEVGFIQTIKLTCKAIRVYWRVSSSRIIMTKLHTKVMKGLIYHYKTTAMWSKECENPVVSYWSDSLKTSKNFVEHIVSEEVLKTMDNYFKDYFSAINNYNSSKEEDNETKDQV